MLKFAQVLKMDALEALIVFLCEIQVNSQETTTSYEETLPHREKQYPQETYHRLEALVKNEKLQEPPSCLSSPLGFTLPKDIIPTPDKQTIPSFLTNETTKDNSNGTDDPQTPPHSFTSGVPPPPPPPPLPGPNTGKSNPAAEKLPFGMKEKKKYSPNLQMKRLNWVKVDYLIFYIMNIKKKKERK